MGYGIRSSDLLLKAYYILCKYGLSTGQGCIFALVGISIVYIEEVRAHICTDRNIYLYICINCWCKKGPKKNTRRLNNTNNPKRLNNTRVTR